MIEGIKSVSYESYNIITNSNDVHQYKNEETTQSFDIQEILKNLGEYVYSENDLESVDKGLVDELKIKFDIKEEDIYKLRKNGYDLERLYIEDVNYYSSVVSSLSFLSQAFDTSKTAQIGEKIGVIKKQSDTMYLNSLYSAQPITINSLYQSNFKGNFQKTSLMHSDKDIAKVLEMNGLTNTQGNMWAAGKLAEYGLAINRHDVAKLQNIKAAVESLDQQEELQKAQEDLALGKEAGERPLIEDDHLLYSDKDIKDIKGALGKVEDADIEELISSGEEITINQLKATLFKNTDLALKRNKALHFTEGQKRSIEAVKEQIHHIRAKLTTEAAQKMSEKMPLESSQLSEVAETLNRMENEKILQAVKEADIPLSDENAEIIRNVIQVRQEIFEHREVTLELELRNEQIQLQEIHQALMKYGQNETPVEQRFGENIKTVENQIEGLLTSLGVKATPEMIQAAKALITNSMEVNRDNLTRAQDIMIKMNTFIEEMTPAKTAMLIKEGLNPYHASIDMLLTWISGEQIDQLKEDIAEAIVALSERGMINSDQKEALIGFYRIIQSVDQNKEEVVGYLLKNNLPLTIEKLQEAAKYAGSQGVIEAAVDNQFGEIKELKLTAETAKMMIEESKEQISKGIDIIKMLEQMELPVTDANVDKLKKINALLYPIIKEQFKKELGKFEGMATLPKSFLEKLEAVKRVDPKVVSYMLREGIAPTVSNIYYVDKMVKNPELYKELLNDAGLLRESFPESFEELREELSQQEEEAAKHKEAALEKGNMLEYRTYKQIEEVIHLQKELSQKDGVYQIPFMIQGEEKMVHLYFNQKRNKETESDGSTTAIITYDTSHLGMITAYIQFKEDHVSYKIQGENREATGKLQEESQFLDQLLEQIGYTVKASYYEAFENNDDRNNRPSLIKRGESDFEEMV